MVVLGSESPRYYPRGSTPRGSTPRGSESPRYYPEALLSKLYKLYKLCKLFLANPSQVRGGLRLPGSPLN